MVTRGRDAARMRALRKLIAARSPETTWLEAATPVGDDEYLDVFESPDDGDALTDLLLSAGVEVDLMARPVGREERERIARAEKLPHASA